MVLQSELMSETRVNYCHAVVGVVPLVAREALYFAYLSGWGVEKQHFSTAVLAVVSRRGLYFYLPNAVSQMWLEMSQLHPLLLVLSRLFCVHWKWSSVLKRAYCVTFCWCWFAYFFRFRWQMTAQCVTLVMIMFMSWLPVASVLTMDYH